jgi:hypothetical protein
MAGNKTPFSFLGAVKKIKKRKRKMAKPLMKQIKNKNNKKTY